MYYKVVVPGEPKAKARPRWAKWGMYSPKKTVEYENLIRLCFMEQNPGAKLLEGAVDMDLEAYFAVPASKSKKAKLAMLGHRIRPTKRPDVDNLIKIFADSITGMAYKDDAQICTVVCKKLYSTNPHCVCAVIQKEAL